MQPRDGSRIDVLEHGFVRLVDFMGSDVAVSRAARVSYDAAWRAGEDEGSDAKLIRYLWKNHHTTPFEAVSFTFEVKAPIFVFRQWHRHRTWSFHELSARYRELPEEFYLPTPEMIGQQSASSKQARDIGAPVDVNRYGQHFGCERLLFATSCTAGLRRNASAISQARGSRPALTSQARDPRAAYGVAGGPRTDDRENGRSRDLPTGTGTRRYWGRGPFPKDERSRPGPDDVPDAPRSRACGTFRSPRVGLGQPSAGSEGGRPDRSRKALHTDGHLSEDQSAISMTLGQLGSGNDPAGSASAGLESGSPGQDQRETAAGIGIDSPGGEPIRRSSRPDGTGVGPGREGRS